jgi:hypothetical protein
MKNSSSGRLRAVNAVIASAISWRRVRMLPLPSMTRPIVAGASSFEKNSMARGSPSS